MCWAAAATAEARHTRFSFPPDCYHPLHHPPSPMHFRVTYARARANRSSFLGRECTQPSGLAFGRLCDDGCWYETGSGTTSSTAGACFTRSDALSNELTAMLLQCNFHLPLPTGACMRHHHRRLRHHRRRPLAPGSSCARLCTTYRRAWRWAPCCPPTSTPST